MSEHFNCNALVISLLRLQISLCFLGTLTNDDATTSKTKKKIAMTEWKCLFKHSDGSICGSVVNGSTRIPHANRMHNGIQMFEPHMQAKITFPTIKKDVREIAIIFLFFWKQLFLCVVFCFR